MILTPLASNSWKFRDVSTKSWQRATVPGCVHTDLRAAGLIPDPFFAANELELQWIGERDWEYRTYLTPTAEVRRAEITELVADGLDTVATVFFNGQELGKTENMFVGHRWPIHHLFRKGRNELRIVFHSAEKFLRARRTDFTPPREYCDPVGNAVRLRKQPSQFGWDWAPRLITAGIWRDLRLESWNGQRLGHVHITQSHENPRAVELIIAPEILPSGHDAQVTAVCGLNGTEIARASGPAGTLRLKIVRPELWWPAGQGSQPLYDLTVTVTNPIGAEIGSVRRRIGLRTITLDRRPDRWGESFRFLVNRRPIFAKGANWVPAHSFVTTLTRERYARDLAAAVSANMNCLRVWGGGIYESEHFYDLCDELGLLVWHDFMFSCALYPADKAFLQTVRAEAIDQVKRLHDRACLALWCGNNELAQLNGSFLRTDPELMRGYKKVFHELLPEVVAAHDGVTAYWPSSEWRGTFESGHALGEKSGDSHFWDVWHARHPVKDYEKWAFRFCSEFGMQSYSSVPTNATFCPPDDCNLLGPSMENHQKNAHGNQIIIEYVLRRYRLPRTQADFIYLSQLNQAYCMQIGVEHYRRLMPRCMGALYWQLNDCWPATSWSSIEFTGRWKALHHAARRFNAPSLVSGHVLGDDVTSIGNYRSSTVRGVNIYTVHDGPTSHKALLRWHLVHLNGRTLLSGRQRVVLEPRRSVKQENLRLSGSIAVHGLEQLYVRLALEIEGRTVSEQTVFLTSPRFMPLPSAKIDAETMMSSRQTARVTFRSKVFQHAVAFDFLGLAHEADDNFFDLYPNEAKEITVKFDAPVTLRKVQLALQYHSLADTYD